MPPKFLAERAEVTYTVWVYTPIKNDWVVFEEFNSYKVAYTTAEKLNQILKVCVGIMENKVASKPTDFFQ